jgi:uracil-DNA glycosylase family 4
VSNDALAKAHTRWGHVRLIDGQVSNKPAGAACEKCPLRDRPCVPTERNKKARIAIVGEAPGATELREGRPFIGPSGRLLQKILGAIGYDREDVTWTNAALCEVRDDKELKAAAKACAARLQEELVGVKYVVPVGGHALGSVLGLTKKPSILKARGFIYRQEKRLVMPTLHPAFVLRAPLWHGVIGCDFERIHKVSTQGWLPPEKLLNRRRLLIKTVEALKRELATLEKTISLDVETTEEPATRNKLICFSMTDVSGAKTIVVPWSNDMTGEGAYFGRRQAEAAEIVTDALQARRSVTHNGPSFDHIVLARHGIYVGDWDDTLIAHHAFASHMPQRLSHVVSIYLDAPPWKEQREDTIKDLYRYNSQDTLYTALAWNEMQKDLKPETSIYDMDCISSDLCRDMQENGFRYDVERSKVLQRHLERQAKRASRKAARIVGEPINLASPKQLRAAFFDKLDAPVFFKSMKTGQPALNVDALRAYAGYADPRLVELSLATLDYRKANKINGTYIKPIQVDSENRVHPSWRSFGAVSGRFACRDPNLMNLPRPENDPSIGLGGIRSLYVAAPGNVIVAFDCSQLEMRIAAYVSSDEVMISACETDDLHSANAAVLFGDAFTGAEPKGPEWKMLRTIAKTSGFAIAYMASAPTVYARIVAQGLDMTFAQVEALLKKMRQTFVTYYEWQDENLHRTIRLGYVEAPITGRKHWLGHTPKPTENANFPIQSGAADHMNLLLPKLMGAMPSDVKLIAQVHDAAMFDVPERRADEVVAIINEIALRPVEVKGRSVVFPIDVKVGGKWSEV